MRGSALVLRSIQLLDDEDQIARESVFRAERIPERIDRPMPRIHVRGLSAFCLKVIFTACCRRHAFFFIRLFLRDPWQLNVFYFILFRTLTLSQCPDHWRILKLFHRISRCPILSAENLFCPDGLWRYYYEKICCTGSLPGALPRTHCRMFFQNGRTGCFHRGDHSCRFCGKHF